MIVLLHHKCDVLGFCKKNKNKTSKTFLTRLNVFTLLMFTPVTKELLHKQTQTICWWIWSNSKSPQHLNLNSTKCYIKVTEVAVSFLSRNDFMNKIKLYRMILYQCALLKIKPMFHLSSCIPSSVQNYYIWEKKLKTHKQQMEAMACKTLSRGRSIMPFNGLV